MMKRPGIFQKDKRAESRSRVLFTAILSSPAGLQSVRVRNMSGRGAMLGGVTFPPPGTRVTLRRGELQMPGSIIWRREKWAGIAFDEAVDVQAWVQHNRRLAAGQIAEDQGEELLAEHLVALQRETDRVTFAWVSNRLAEISDRLANSAPMRVELAEVLIEIDSLAGFLRSGGNPYPMRDPLAGRAAKS